MDMTLELDAFALVDKIIQCDASAQRVAWQGLLIQRHAAASDRTARFVHMRKCCRRCRKQLSPKGKWHSVEPFAVLVLQNSHIVLSTPLQVLQVHGGIPVVIYFSTPSMPCWSPAYHSHFDNLKTLAFDWHFEHCGDEEMECLVRLECSARERAAFLSLNKNYGASRAESALSPDAIQRRIMVGCKVRF